MTVAVPLEEGWIDRIHQGDGIETMQRLPDGGVHLVFADLAF
jgi:DNA modification methylase